MRKSDGYTPHSIGGWTDTIPLALQKPGRPSPADRGAAPGRGGSGDCDDGGKGLVIDLMGDLTYVILNGILCLDINPLQERSKRMSRPKPGSHVLNRWGYRLDFLSDTEKNEIVKAYSEGLESIGRLASRYHKSRTSIWKLLRSRGIPTAKELGVTRRQLECSYCGEPVVKRRAYLRETNPKHVFCNQDHYAAWLRISGYIPNRNGQRRGRGTVESIYGPLPEGSVVHHIDGNCFNNFPSNLMLFSGHGDHVKWHRDKRDGIVPLWDGARA